MPTGKGLALPQRPSKRDFAETHYGPEANQGYQILALKLPPPVCKKPLTRGDERIFYDSKRHLLYNREDFVKVGNTPVRLPSIIA